jgi:hypothetical protein
MGVIFNTLIENFEGDNQLGIDLFINNWYKIEDKYQLLFWGMIYSDYNKYWETIFNYDYGSDDKYNYEHTYNDWRIIRYDFVKHRDFTQLVIDFYDSNPRKLKEYKTLKQKINYEKNMV